MDTKQNILVTTFLNGFVSGHHKYHGLEFQEQDPCGSCTRSFLLTARSKFSFWPAKTPTLLHKRAGNWMEKGRGQRKRNGILMELRTVFDSSRNSDREAKAGN